MQESNSWLASRLLDYRVRNSAGEDLGKIEDVVADPETGNIQYAILSFGGVFGMGNKLFPIPWSSLQMSPNRDYVLLDMTHCPIGQIRRGADASMIITVHRRQSLRPSRSLPPKSVCTWIGMFIRPGEGYRSSAESCLYVLLPVWRG